MVSMCEGVENVSVYRVKMYSLWNRLINTASCIFIRCCLRNLALYGMICVMYGIWYHG